MFPLQVFQLQLMKLFRYS